MSQKTSFLGLHTGTDGALCQGRLLTRGKPPKLALTACMRKLLMILNAILRQRMAWRDARSVVAQHG